MSIRVRLILLILLVGILPLGGAVFWTTGYMENLALESTQRVVQELSKDLLYDQALTAVGQVESYLELHPETTVLDRVALREDKELRNIAVQPVGKTGYTAVHDDEAVIYFHPNLNLVGENLMIISKNLPELIELVELSLDGTVAEGKYIWRESDGTLREKYMVIMPIKDTQLRLAATAYLEEFDRPAQTLVAELDHVTSQTRQRFMVYMAFVGAISVIVAVGTGWWLTEPILAMARVADRVMQGDWDAMLSPDSVPSGDGALSDRRDELGDLSRVLYAMTSRLRDSVQSLEQQVVERTANLERRARYLEATAAVARDTVAVLDLEELLPRVVNLVSESFGFYHAGLYLLDPSGEWIELRAASSRGGQAMLARQHRLRVGAPGLVGFVAEQGRPRVAHDVGTDAGFFDSPDLPETHSEVTLPLLARGSVGRGSLLGVLDVQSRESEAFSVEDVTIFQTLADQVAVAICNARLLQQARTSADAVRRARGELELEAWQVLLHAQSDLTYRSTQRGTFVMGEGLRPEMLAALQTAQPARDGTLFLDGAPAGTGGTGWRAIPIQIGGHVIGVVAGRKAQDAGEWTADERTLLNTLTAQLNAAVERARLYRETQRNAARQRTIAEVGARMRESLELETMLHTAAHEVRQALNLGDVVIRLAAPETQGADGSEVQ